MLERRETLPMKHYQTSPVHHRTPGYMEKRPGESNVNSRFPLQLKEDGDGNTSGL